MSTSIKILPEYLTNKIAAGEVVERPASVVKELVENALDAGASDIAIDIEAGGRRLIRISDDGSGMSRNDALLALERHATSKIRSDQDLFNLSTMGFRGEALPSIASVSRLTLQTREPRAVEGTEIYLEGGKVVDVKACGMAHGTVVSVRSLFFNTPARLKFMKSSETEAAHIGEVVARLAISRPDVRFSYSRDSRVVFRVSPSESRDRIGAMLGGEISKVLHPLEYESQGTKISGLVAEPSCHRSSSSHVYAYINGRFVRDRVVQHAVLQAYRNSLERGRYPVAVLFIDLPPGEVDVNVHPTKHEVRFREQTHVHDAIVSALEKTLAAIRSGKMRAPVIPATASYVKTKEPSAEVHDSWAGYHPVHGPAPSPAKEETVRSSFPPETELPVASPASTCFGSMRIIGQFQAAYILCETGQDLVLVDQHAAHERIVYERLRKEFVSSSVETQRLLFPESLELTFRDTAAILQNAERLQRLGFDLERFGGNTWLLVSVPRIFSDADYVETLRDILEELQSFGRSGSFEQTADRIFARIACHAVVRGSHPLSQEEMRVLLREMDSESVPETCPHGRPLFRKITLSEIEKMFKR